MTITNDLVSEMDRCLRALKAYQQSCKDGSFQWTSNPAHAAAMRATMDVTRSLTVWRHTGINTMGEK